MGKSVAVDGEVKTTVGTTLLTATGTWKAGEISYSTYDKLKVSGVKVTYQAECKFSFKGTDNSSGTTVNVEGEETITLNANTTLLQKNGLNVLVNGDTKPGLHGNSLSVETTNKLKTS